jgi:hypothetical protein
MQIANLPLGQYDYLALKKMFEEGEYRWASVTTATGRQSFLVGISPDQLAAMSATLMKSRVGSLISGSRVVGPRSEQRKLHPALAYTPLMARERVGSATYPTLSGVQIEKRHIKEFGLHSAQTSDLSMLLIDHLERPANDLLNLAVNIENSFKQLGCSFPIRVFFQLKGRTFISEQSYVDFGIKYFILPDLPKGAEFPRGELERAFKETYAMLGS